MNATQPETPQVPPDLSGWQEAAWRQYLRLNLDAPARIVATCLAFLMAAFFVQPTLTLIAFGLYVLSEILAAPIMSGFAARPSRVRSNIYLLNSFIGTSGYSVVVALLWFSDAVPVKVAAIGYLSGAFINTVAVNTIYMPMAASKAIPLSLISLMMPISILIESNFNAESIFALTTSIVLTGYVLRLGYDIHRTEITLATARRDNRELALAKARFLATMSHEIRTPLNAILGVSQIAGSNPVIVNQADFSRSLAMLEESALSLQASIEDAMAVAEQGELTAFGRIVLAPLRQNLRLARTRVLASAQERGLDLQMILADGLPERAYLDPILLRRAVISTLQHMVLTAPPGSQDILFSARADMSAEGTSSRPGFNLALQFECKGPLQDDRDPLFLAAAETAVAWMNGQIEIDIKQKQVARVQIILPMAREARPEAAETDGKSLLEPKQEARAAARALNILVVDDISSNRFIIAHLLRARGMRVVEAANGQMALDLLRHDPFDVVLMDMNMPGMSGGETFLQIRGSGQGWSGVPVIAVTAETLEAQRAGFEALGLSGFIAKPVDSNQMVAEIAAVLASARQQNGPGTVPGPSRSG